MQKKFRLRTCLAALLMLCGLTVHAQNAFLRVDVDTTTYNSIEHTGTVGSFSSNDDGYCVVTCPFAFSFGVSGFNPGWQIACSANGFMYLDTNVSSGTAAAYTGGARVIQPFLSQDGYLGRTPNAKMLWKVDSAGTGDARHRVLIIEYFDLNLYTGGTTDRFNYQVVFHEGLNNIEFIYGQMYKPSSITSRCYIRDGRAQKTYALTGADWGNPTFSVITNNAQPATRATTTLPAVGLRYTFVAPHYDCDFPHNLRVAVRDVDSIKLAWDYTAGDAINSWVVEWSNAPFTQGASTATRELRFDPEFTAYNLAPNTPYYFYVYSVCPGGSDSYSMPLELTVRTVCEPYPASSLPHFYGFEDASGTASTSTINPCWVKGTNSATAYPYPSSTSASGVRSLYFYATTSYYSYLAAPAFDTNVRDLVVTFKLYKNSTTATYGVMDVGVMTDPYDYNTFERVQTVECGDNLSVWKSFAVSLDSYTGRGRYIAFRANQGGTNNVYLDDINIAYKEECMPVTGVEVRGNTATSAYIDWRYDEGLGLNPPTGYRVHVTPSTGAAYWQNTTTNGILLTGLTPGTGYRVAVYSDCGSHGYGWGDSASFRTDGLGCATYDAASARTITPSDTTGTTTNYIGIVSNGSNYGYRQELYLASTIGMPSGGTIRGIDIKYQYSTAMTYKTNCTIYLANVTRTTMSSNFEPFDVNMFIPVYVGPLNCRTGWNHFDFYQPFNYTGGNLLVTVVDNSGQYNSTSYIFPMQSITNMVRYTTGTVRINPYSPGTGSTQSVRSMVRFNFANCMQTNNCPAPMLLTSMVSTDSIGLVWGPGNTETSFTLEYKLSTSSTWTPISVAASERSTFLSNLTPNTQYQIRVTSGCGQSTTINVKTTCLPTTLPFFENFNTWTASSSATTAIPSCWHRGSNASSGSTVYPYVNSSYDRSNYATKRAMYLYRSSASHYTYVALPFFEAPVDSLVVDFSYIVGSATASYQSVPVAVGVMTDPEDYSTFVPVQTFTGELLHSHKWFDVSVSMESYHGNGKYIAIAAIPASTPAYSYVYIDDISVYRRPTCQRPYNLKATDVTATAATLSWNADASEPMYRVLMGAEDFDNNMPTFDTVVSGSSVSFTNLSPAFNYEARVYALCDYNDSSLMSVVKFNTADGIIKRSALPYKENFNYGLATSTTPYTTTPRANCWVPFNTYNGNHTYPYRYFTGTYIIEHAMLYFYSNTSGYYSTIAMPRFEVPMDSITLEFNLGKTSSTAEYGKMEVGLIPDLNSLDALQVYGTYTPTTTINSSTGAGWQTFEQTFENAPDSMKYIVFRHKTSGASNTVAYLKDVKVYYNTTCKAPTAAFAYNFSPTSADVRFIVDPSSTASEYEFVYSKTNDINDAIGSIISATSPIHLTDLEPNTRYYAWMRGACEGDNNRRWFTLDPFTTQPACSAPQNTRFYYNNAAQYITVSWTPSNEGYPATNYHVSYKKEQDTAWIEQSTAETFFVIRNVDTMTTYQVRINTDCDTFHATQLTGSYSTVDCHVSGGSVSVISPTVPTNQNWRYSYTQSIYPPNELTNIGDTIYGIYYHGIDYDEVDESSMGPRNVKLWIGHTNQASFESVDDYIDIAQHTLVFDDTINMGRNGWIYLPFSVPVVQNRSMNTVISMQDSNDDYYDSWYFYGTDAESRTLYFYQDDEYINPIRPSSPNQGVANYVPQVRFNAACFTPTCVAPVVVFAGSTSTTASVRWFRGHTESAWRVDYRLSTESTWRTAVANTTDSTLTISGLNSSSDYVVRVFPICGGSVNNNIYTDLTVSTSCGPLQLPISENFDARNVGNFSANCWIVGPSTAMPYVSNMMTVGKVLRLGGSSYVMLPELIPAVNTLQARFDFMGENPNSWMVIGVVEDENSIMTFQAVDTLRAGDSALMHSRTVSFANYSGAGRIAFYVPNGMGYNYIDNLVVEPIGCGAPSNLTVDVVTSNSANLQWTTASGASTYIVEYGPAHYPKVDSLCSRVLAVGGMMGITGLSPRTLYMARVYSVCASTHDTSYAEGPVYFTTACSQLTIGDTETFDLGVLPASTYTHKLPPCWAYEMRTSNATYLTPNYQTQIYRGNSSYATSGNACMYMYGNTVLAMPELPMAAGNYMVEFSHYVSSINYWLIVGVVDSTTPGFSASFTPIDTLRYSSTGRKHSTVYLSTYQGMARHIAFYNLYVSGTTVYDYCTVPIDDVVVRPMPTCAPVRNIYADSNTTGSSVSVNWTDRTPATMWQIEYGRQGFTRGTGTMMTVTSHPTVFSAQPLTYYDVYVRPICSGGDTADWTMGSVLSGACDGSGEVNTSLTGTQATSQYVPVYTYYNYSISEVIIDSIEMAQVGLNPITHYAFYPTSATGGTHANNCRIFLGNTTKSVFSSSSDFVNVDTSANFTLVYSGTMNWTSEGWRVVRFDRPFQWDGHSNVIVVVDRDNGSYVSDGNRRTHSTTGYKSIYGYSDSENPNPFSLTGFGGTKGYLNLRPDMRLVSCELFCSEPAVVVDTVTAETALLTWGSETGNYEVEHKRVTDLDWTADTIVSGTRYMVERLEPMTDYAVRVRRVCDSTSASDWSTRLFTTVDLPCEPVDIDSLSIDASFSTADISWTAAENAASYEVHVWNTANYDSTFTTTTTSVTVGGLVSGVEYHVAIRTVCGLYGAIRSDFSDTTQFTAEVCQPVTNLQGTINTTTATITWTPGSNNTGRWLVEYGYAGYIEGAHIFQDTVEEALWVVEDLEADEQYHFYVRALCGEYISMWDNPVQLTAVASIDDADMANVTLYPNPAHGTTTVSINGIAGQVSVEVVNINGARVSLTTLDCSGDCAKTLNLDNLSAGAYFVRIKGEKLDVVRKLIVR
ncbi:MAG: fibronectin type III domain-containing protein [Bacteroidales bacterium]|nr:fibronectin type III domain-containing protein [Bacteroidales bacterium]